MQAPSPERAGSATQHLHAPTIGPTHERTALPLPSRANEAHHRSSEPRTCSGVLFLFRNKTPSRCFYSVPGLVGAGFSRKARLNQRRGADDLGVPAVRTQQRTCLSWQRGLPGTPAPKAGTPPAAEHSSPFWCCYFHAELDGYRF